MNLNRLKHVVALAEERSFARASERVNLSQPAFSRSIQAAEAEVGILLFDRGTTGVTPTPAGIFVIERARKLLFDSRCLERDISLYKQSQTGDVPFGAGPFPAATLLPTLMPELRLRYPDVAFRVEVNNWTYLLDHLRNEALDFFVADTRDLPHGPDLDIITLAQQPGGFYVRAGHPLLTQAMVRATDITTYGVASVRLPQRIRMAMTQLLALEPEAPLPMVLECDDVQTLKCTALGSDSVLGAVHAAVINEVASGQLVQLQIANMPPLYSEVGIVALRGRSHSPIGKFVIERLRELATQ